MASVFDTLEQKNNGDSGSYSSNVNFLTEPEDGYDFEFVNLKDDKYDCPICLLILRDPVQTPCGHRFCHKCIHRWLSESGEQRCPVDNTTVIRDQVFPDNFAKREILSLQVKCPKSKEGCKVIEVLKQLPKHLEACGYVPIPCPNECSDILLRKDLPHHLSQICTKRKIVCCKCGDQVTAEREQEHLHKECPMVTVVCQYCQLELLRNQIKSHEEFDCQRVIVPCQYQPMGCTTRLERCEMSQHLHESIQQHMNLMFSILMQLTSAVQSIAPGALHHFPAVPQSHSLPVTSSEQSITNLLETLRIGVQQQGMNVLSLNSTPVPYSPDSNASSIGGFPEPVAGSHSHGLIERNISEQTQVAPSLSYSSQQSNKDVEGGAYVSVQQEYELKSLKDQNVTQDESLARHEHQIDEIRGRNENHEKIVKDLNKRLKMLESTINEFEGRTCNGTYVWKIRNYRKYRREAEIGDTTAIHSPPFYSHFYGYKLCIRANLNGVDSARGTHLSIFIHFMQGDYDDILDWPFNGRIILTVIDQNPVCELRHHVVETLISKPNLAAFQRPNTPRNHKGFGYMEFLPIGILDNSTYVRNDTLIIKACILPNG